VHRLSMQRCWGQTGPTGAGIPAVAVRRGQGDGGLAFEHATGSVYCTDAKFHRHCKGRWRGSISLGFDKDGNRIRKKISAKTKTAAQGALDELREELGKAPRPAGRIRSIRQWLTGWTVACPAGRSGPRRSTRVCSRSCWRESGTGHCAS